MSDENETVTDLKQLLESSRAEVRDRDHQIELLRDEVAELSERLKTWVMRFDDVCDVLADPLTLKPGEAKNIHSWWDAAVKERNELIRGDSTYTRIAEGRNQRTRLQDAEKYAAAQEAKFAAPLKAPEDEVIAFAAKNAEQAAKALRRFANAITAKSLGIEIRREKGADNG